MFDIKEIKEPLSLNEALKELDDNKGLKIICGGTDVLIKLHHGKMNDAELLSINNLDIFKDVKTISEEEVISKRVIIL